MKIQNEEGRGPAWLTVVGIGDDGFAGLGRPARRALMEASVIYGGERHLSMLPARLGARQAAWPRPFDLAPLLARRGEPVCVLASGDPMLFGVGATLARHVPADELRVLPAPSSLSLAAARLGWPLQEVATVSVVGRPLHALNTHLHDGARVFVLSADGRTPAALAALLTVRGFGATRMTVLEHLGGAEERRVDGRADQWSANEVAALNLIALQCRATDGAPRLPLTCGLPDDAYRHDGQLTKRDVRAITLARLAPTPGELLWDVGAGSGSIGIEWMRAHPGCRAIAIEGHAERQRFIEHNRDALGVPGLQLVAGRAPQALEGLATPDAVFIGGGVTVPGVLEACWANLRDGGRLIANAVTLQGEAALAAWRERHGGTLTRIALGEAQPLGGFDTWRQALPVTLLEVVKLGHGARGSDGAFDGASGCAIDGDFNGASEVAPGGAFNGASEVACDSALEVAYNGASEVASEIASEIASNGPFQVALNGVSEIASDGGASNGAFKVALNGASEIASDGGATNGASDRPPADPSA